MPAIWYRDLLTAYAAPGLTRRISFLVSAKAKMSDHGEKICLDLVHLHLDTRYPFICGRNGSSCQSQLANIKKEDKHLEWQSYGAKIFCNWSPSRFSSIRRPSSDWDYLLMSVQVPILVARYAGKKELSMKLRDAVRAHQSTNEAFTLSAALAAILERVVLGTSLMVGSLFPSRKLLLFRLSSLPWPCSTKDSFSEKCSAWQELQNFS